MIDQSQGCGGGAAKPGEVSDLPEPGVWSGAGEVSDPPEPGVQGGAAKDLEEPQDLGE